MRQVYCDNSSISFPKALELGALIGAHIDHKDINISQGGYQKAYGVEGAVIETKDLLCDLFHFNRNQSVVFTPGATASLNMIIKGILKKGGHIITASMEHNAVVRPIRQISVEGVEWDEAVCSDKGELALSAIERLIKSNTEPILVTHGSNVCGTVVSIAEIAAI